MAQIFLTRSRLQIHFWLMDLFFIFWVIGFHLWVNLFFRQYLEVILTEVPFRPPILFSPSELFFSFVLLRLNFKPFLSRNLLFPLQVFLFLVLKTLIVGHFLANFGNFVHLFPLFCFNNYFPMNSIFSPISYLIP